MKQTMAKLLAHSKMMIMASSPDGSGQAIRKLENKL